MSSGQRQGRWSGVPLPDRQARRRDELIAAGVSILGDELEPALTVRAVCRTAGLTERYFYEGFADRDEFVAAVYDEVCTTAMAELASSTTVLEAVQRFVSLMVDDPTRGRVLLIAPAKEPVLAQSGATWIGRFIELLQHTLFHDTDPQLRAMEATGLIGALTALFSGYLSGTLTVSRDQFVDHCAQLLMRERRVALDTGALTVRT